MLELVQTATNEVLRKRANVISLIRKFFAKHEVLEVETPTLGLSTNPDVNLESLAVNGQQPFYLQTSPEFFMKRLLANGIGDIFQLSKAFRDDELGQYHNLEFTILEWYRTNMDYHELIDEVHSLISSFLEADMLKISYQQLFWQMLKVNPLTITIEQCQNICAQHQLRADFVMDVSGWLDYIFSHIMQTKLPKGMVFIYDYPVAQAALAKIQKGVAQRFELYIDGIEIANGFQELNSTSEQTLRFMGDQQQRQSRSLPAVSLDAEFLHCLDTLPNCSGVALGVDRLIMLLLHKESIGQVLSFSLKQK